MSGFDRGFFRMGLECAVWPSNECEVTFRGHKLRLMPETETLAPSIIVTIDASLSQTEAQALLQAFLSTYAWVRDAKILETFSTFSTGAPIGVGKVKPGAVRSNAPVEYLPDPADRKARLAMALYREALSVNMPAYAFLGYFNVLNILFRSGDDQKAWIQRTVGRLTDSDALKRLAEIEARETDLGEYLHVSGRCAVAHAFADPIADPDEPSDQRRLASDLPVIKALARYAIETEFDVQSQETVWREHLYELEGFRALFGSEAVAELKAGKAVDVGRLCLPERLSVRLQGCERRSTLEALTATVLDAEDGVVRLGLATADGRLALIIHLLFKEERLLFDAMNNVRVDDDGSAAAARAGIDYLRFLVGWMANGVSEVWDPEGQQRLGRSQPVMLVNMRPDWDAIDAEIRELEERVKTSSASSSNAPSKHPETS